MIGEAWIAAGAGALGLLSGWGAAFFRYRVRQEVERQNVKTLSDAVTALTRSLEGQAKALEAQAEATRRQFAEMNRTMQDALGEFGRAWREELRAVNQHVWEIAGKPERRRSE